jgi:hypothetical protein
MQDLNQKDFTELIKKGVLHQFPKFLDFLKIHNDIMTIEYPSPLGLVTLWITTQGLEVTIGFDDIAGQCTWHTHMSLFGANEPNEELKTSIVLIEDIFSGKEILVYDSDIVVFLTQNPDEEMKINKSDIVLSFKTWNES